MRVLIADKFEQSGRDGLDAAGCDYSYQPDVKDDALVEAIRAYGPEVLVVRSTKVTEPMFDAGPLKLVVRAGAGYNTIDVAAASRRGVYVSNCPGKNSVAVAELAFALMLALDRRIPDNVAELRAGRWNKKEFSKARGLLGRTLGLVGTGQIGREMVERARAFGMRVVAWSRSLTEDRPGVLASVLEAIKAADINVQEMENVIFEGAEAAVARINLDAAPPAAALEQLKAANADIIEISLIELRD
jgi:D-3-phosphoglycerate dehydrogenase